MTQVPAFPDRQVGDRENILEVMTQLKRIRNTINGLLGADNVANDVLTGAGEINGSAHLDWKKLAVMPYVEVTGPSTTHAVGTDLTIPFNTEVKDTAAMWAIGQPTRLVAPVAGLYSVSALVQFGTPGIAMDRLSARRGGTTIVLRSQHPTNHSCPFIVGEVQLAAAEYLEFIFQQNSVGGSPGCGLTFASMAYVGRIT